MMTTPGKCLMLGQFSFLPDMTDAQITTRIEFALSQGFAVRVESTDHPWL